MADKNSDIPPLLRRPLYLYDLPAELLYSLKLHSAVSPALENRPEERSVDKTEPPLKDEQTTSTSCTLCQATFRDVQDQRLHVKSDFHRYNLKLNIKGLPVISEVTFAKQIGDLDESISGSDSEDSEEDDEAEGRKGGDSVLAALLRRQAKVSQANGEAAHATKKKPGAGNAPLLWLKSPKLPDNAVLGLYKAVLSDNEQQEASEHLVEIIKKKQLKPIQSKHSGNTVGKGASAATSDPHVFLCMIGGGHFAASIISLAPEIRKGVGGVEERHAVVKAHKTFHRYTTRRKQGGSQSANDNAKGNAHSAGSSIRRYNESALEQDVRAVLGDWRSMIDTAELLFVRATGQTNRRTLFGPYDGQVLRSNDKRLRGFPFSTRRATQAELLRSFTELTRLKLSTLAQEPVESKTEKTPAPAAKPKVVVPKPTKQEQVVLLHTSQLQALIRRSKAPAVLLYLTKNELDPGFEFYPAEEHHHAPTLLHLAASTNSPAVVLALLTKANANPSITNGDQKTAYDVAGDVKTREAFRLARYQLGETSIDWAAAHVPSAMSPEETEAKAKQEKAEADAAEAQRRKADLEQLQKEEEQHNVGRIEKKAGTGKTLAGIEKSGSEKREEETRGLTSEMRMRLERERRARAAEERLKRMQGTR